MIFVGISELIRPIYNGYPGNMEDYPCNYTMAMRAKDKGGAVSYPHPSMSYDLSLISMKEFPVDLALGALDAVDVLSNSRDLTSMAQWYHGLNSGFESHISAGTDAFVNASLGNDIWHRLPGAARVYVHVPKPYTYRGWVENYRAGHSFGTNGPLLFMTVDDQLPGSVFHFSKRNNPEVKVKVQMISQVPVDRLEIVLNGRVVTEHRPAAAVKEMEFETELSLTESSWIAARVFGPDTRHAMMDTIIFAHTSPVYCYLDGEPVLVEEDLKFMLKWIDEVCMMQVREKAQFSSDARRQEVLDIYARARKIYEERLTRVKKRIR